MKIAPYTQLYQRQIQYYNHTAYDTLADDIDKILPKFLTDHRHKRGAILASILGSVASSVIGLPYEGISSFLHHKRHKALHKHKRGAILASILGSVASSVIGLAYEGISSFLHHKRHKALQNLWQ